MEVTGRNRTFVFWTLKLQSTKGNMRNLKLRFQAGYSMEPIKWTWYATEIMEGALGPWHILCYALNSVSVTAFSPHKTSLHKANTGLSPLTNTLVWDQQVFVKFSVKGHFVCNQVTSTFGPFRPLKGIFQYHLNCHFNFLTSNSAFVFPPFFPIVITCYIESLWHCSNIMIRQNNMPHRE